MQPDLRARPAFTRRRVGAPTIATVPTIVGIERGAILARSIHRALNRGPSRWRLPCLPRNLELPFHCRWVFGRMDVDSLLDRWRGSLGQLMEGASSEAACQPICRKRDSSLASVRT